ncbi:hypothetical protein B0T17DRAFT_504964 [Bombardia bombarda]|uniref:Uncharacterized protein n=1 Tax=Bombardia bombarda TaxID=252184 RepID=A0AA40C8M9_9PEZI|nr:hypothetical protein B0T17DRAFT_504964 [Bombardia bombarda]
MLDPRHQGCRLSWVWSGLAACIFLVHHDWERTVKGVMRLPSAPECPAMNSKTGMIPGSQDICLPLLAGGIPFLLAVRRPWRLTFASFICRQSKTSSPLAVPLAG